MWENTEHKFKRASFGITKIEKKKSTVHTGGLRLFFIVTEQIPVICSNWDFDRVFGERVIIKFNSYLVYKLLIEKLSNQWYRARLVI